MEVLIHLPDLLAKLKIVSYTNFKVEPKGSTLLVTLLTKDDSVKYKINEYLSGSQLAELTKYLTQYQSANNS